MSEPTEALEPQFADLDQQSEVATLGMWVFLATELMFFGGLFLAYAVYRHMYRAEFAAASERLNLVYAGANTVVLLSSSLTMVLAVHAARLERRTALVRFLLLTAGLGTLFLMIKGFEYHGDWQENLTPLLAFDANEWRQRDLQPGGVTLFLLLYYLMTGVHALHLIIGIVIMMILARLASTGRYTASNHAAIEVGGLYWHFVDVIWIFLLPVLYMIGVR